MLGSVEREWRTWIDLYTKNRSLLFACLGFNHSIRSLGTVMNTCEVWCCGVCVVVLVVLVCFKEGDRKRIIQLLWNY